MNTRCRLSLIYAVVLLALPTQAAAQTNIGGNIFDGSGGPLLAGNIYHVISGLGVPAGQTLTIEAGAVVKFHPGLEAVITGKLICNGSASSPVVLTSVFDDDFGGDSLGDGATTGTPGDWKNLILNGATGSILNNVIVRFAGRGAIRPGIALNASNATLNGCTIENGAAYGIDMRGNTTAAIVTGCTIQNNASTAVYGVTLRGLQGFSNNMVSGNGGDFGQLIFNSSETTDVVLGPDNLPGGVLVLSASLSVGVGASLTFEADSVIKMAASFSITMAGTLNCNGTSKRPVVFSAYADDDFGGDTNKDGPSAGAPGSWRGLTFLAGSSASHLKHTIIRYAGATVGGGITLSAADVTLEDCSIMDCAQYGLFLSGNTYGATISNCNIINNGFDAIFFVPIEALPGFSNNKASGNGRDIIHVTGDSSVNADLTIKADNLINNVMVLSDHLGVDPNVTLRVEAGVIIKMTSGFLVDVAGGLELAGTAFDPVIITSFEDDEVGGDSNADGAASLPAKADWRGIMLRSTARSSRLENVLLRYGGANLYRGVYCTSPLATLRSVRVEHWGFNGIELLNHTSSPAGEDAINLVAFDCSGTGISLFGGGFQLLHATATNCASVGISKIPSFTGSVHNSVAWGNASGNFSGFAIGEVFHSNGSPVLAGSNGNIDQDPLFIDDSLGAGDLRLSLASPCIDNANMFVANQVLKDHREHSRALDPGLSGILAPDMGAYEYDLWEMSVLGGRPQLGGQVSFRVDGPAGNSLYLLGLLDGNSLMAPLGFVTCGKSSLVALGMVAVGSKFKLPMPTDLTLVGTQFGIQTLTMPSMPLGVGAVTNLYRQTLEAPGPRKGRKTVFVGRTPSELP